MIIKPTDNFFFAVLTETAADGQVQMVADERAAALGPPGYWVPRNCRHVSIASIGDGQDVSEARLAVLMAAVEGLTSTTFKVSFNRFQSWLGRSRPWVLTGDEGVIGFQQLFDSLRSKLNAAGFATPWPRKLTPHMTLARHGPHADPMVISPISWNVTELVLVQSHVGEGRYTIVGRWPLLPPPAMAA